jgi:GDP/UDP-N,N'-diacetylbacillosamine 2-epimerase (hydrolysing)
VKRVCVITGSRAEYGLLRWVMNGLKNSQVCQLQTLVTGMHLSPEFGSTWKIIELDGFSIDWKVEMLLGSDTATAISKSMGLSMIGFADAFAHLKPDLVVILGDRFEILAAASAALIAGIPLAHLHGGELTEGAYDDSIRHALTKMSHLHFTAAEPYRERVIQMGEDPKRVWNVGGFGLDSIDKLDRMARVEVESRLGLSLSTKSLLVTFHPETSPGSMPELQLQELLFALEETDAQIVFTMPNADNGNSQLRTMIEEFTNRREDRAVVHVSLGQRLYLSALGEVDAIVGNSSSGLLEAPALGTGTVNIGRRQDGRLRAQSVVDCEAERLEIGRAIARVFAPEFQEQMRNQENPYGNGGASAKTVSVIENWLQRGIEGPKKFYDLIKTEHRL